MDSSSGNTLFGLEVEFGLTVFDREGGRLDAHEALCVFLRECADRLTYLTDRSGERMFLANGSLLYPDVGHPEYSTAESPSPDALLQSLRAGERILADAARELASAQGAGAVNLYRTNVDYGSIGTTWGSHESYLARRFPKEYAQALVPHLVSRVVYTGAGGFNNFSRGAAFVLSPRSFHLNTAVGPDRAESRAILGLRDESLCRGDHHRLHLICGETNCSELSTYLKAGTTALIVAMVDGGVDPGISGYELVRPVRAMQRFSSDTGCAKRAPGRTGRLLSALDIQYHYLELAEACRNASFMPGWSGEVCDTWRTVLDQLNDNPESLVGSLDWPTKLVLFRRHVQSHSSISWESLPAWSYFVGQVSRALGTTDRLNLSQIMAAAAGTGRVAGCIRRAKHRLAGSGLDIADLHVFQSLRDELCALDMRYGQLYPQGVFIELDAAGLIHGKKISPQQVEAAIHRAPVAGRAQTRGDWVRRLAGTALDFHCNWSCIVGRSTYLDLGDPFNTDVSWRSRKLLDNEINLFSEGRH